MFGLSLKQTIGGIAGIILGIIVSLINPPASLDTNAMIALGVFICAVTWWIVEVLPDYVTAILMCSAWVVFKVVPFTTAFAAFSGTTFWLLVGALGMGVGVAQSGLLARTALLVMSKFPATYKGMTTAIFAVGVILNPLIPSATAKVSIVAPFSKAIGEQLGFKNQSEGMGGLFAAMFMSLGVLYPMFLSASFFNYTLVGLLPADIGSTITWMSWFSSSWVWGLVVTIGAYFAIQFLYKPKEQVEMGHGYIKGQQEAMGPMKKQEKIVLIILAVSLILWMTERAHGISATLVALAALCLMLGFKIIERPDFRAKIAWDSIIFIGCIINLAAVFPALGIDKWVALMVGPYIFPLMSNMYVFVVVLAVLLFFLRFVLVSQTATLTIFVVLLTPLAIEAGINPLVTAFAVLCSVNLWNVIYQNTTFLAANYAADGMIKHSQTIKMSVAYAALNIVALLTSVPLWQITGMIP
jgi:DASS family divalent anion:Na+ symporter